MSVHFLWGSIPNLVSRGVGPIHHRWWLLLLIFNGYGVFVAEQLSGFEGIELAPVTKLPLGSSTAEFEGRFGLLRLLSPFLNPLLLLLYLSLAGAGPDDDQGHDAQGREGHYPDPDRYDPPEAVFIAIRPTCN